MIVAAARIPRWVDNFVARHGATGLATADGALTGTATDGSTFSVRLPFDMEYAGPAEPEAFAAAMVPPARWGVLLVRKGGFAVARLERDRLVDSKVGQRHVQGRTKAGGQSQQRFARRRGNQARQAYAAAADHAARILAGRAGAGGVPGLPLVVGGDHAALEEVLADPRLRDCWRTGPWLDVADPRRKVLEQAIADARGAVVSVVNA